MADAVEKVAVAKQKKDSGDQAFKAGDLKGALLHYHQALFYLQGIDKNVMNSMNGGASAPLNSSVPDEEKEPTEIEDILSKIYGNQSACHIKNSNWKRAWETADKALEKNKKNYKAQFRKGKAQAELGYVEKSIATLEDLLQKNPTDAAAVNAEIARIKAVDKEREKKHNKKFKGFLNRASTSKADETETSSSSNLQPSGLTEVTEEDIAVEEARKKAKDTPNAGTDVSAPIDLTG